MSMNISGELVKKLRLERGWTQEHLAALAKASPKTIQRVEATGVCSLETRSALAAVFQIDATLLDGEKRIEQAKSATDEGLLFYHRLTTGREVVDIFEGSWWYRFTHEDAKTAEDVDLIAGAVQSIHDWSEIWGDIEPGSKIKATFEIGELIKELESRGLWVFGLRTKSTFKLPHRDGTNEKQTVPVCNIHVAYADSEKVIVLDPLRAN